MSSNLISDWIFKATVNVNLGIWITGVAFCLCAKNTVGIRTALLVTKYSESAELASFILALRVTSIWTICDLFIVLAINSIPPFITAFSAAVDFKLSTLLSSLRCTAFCSDASCYIVPSLMWRVMTASMISLVEGKSECKE